MSEATPDDIVFHIERHVSDLFLIADEGESSTPWWVLYCCGEKVCADVNEDRVDAKAREMRAKATMVVARAVQAVLVAARQREMKR